MKFPKISIITVVKDGMPYLQSCIKSFDLQKYPNKEHIIIFSKSKDSTYFFLKTAKKKNRIFFYDKISKNKWESINLGLKLTKGDIIGLLHSDDVFYQNNTLNLIRKNFKNEINCIYGDILFSKRNNLKKISRVWKSENFHKKKLKFGWMPPHVSIFLKKKIAKNIIYKTKYKISSDYDFIIRLFNNEKLIPLYMKNYIQIMRLGGQSTTIKNYFKKFNEDLQIAKEYFKYYYLCIVLKILRKIFQIRLISNKIDSLYLNNLNKSIKL
jgi:glycosyltransferase